MISGYKITTEMFATYDIEVGMWSGYGTVDIFKRDVGEPIVEHFETARLLEETSDELFDSIADNVEKLLWDSRALDEGSLTDDA